MKSRRNKKGEEKRYIDEILIFLKWWKMFSLFFILFMVKKFLKIYNIKFKLSIIYFM